MKPVSLLILVLGLVTILGHYTARRVEAQAGQPTHQSIQNQLNNVETKVDGVQTTVESIETKVDSIQSQLNHLPPTWDQTLPAAQRFVLVMGGAAALDKETGLVWDQAPDTTTRSWSYAQFLCNNRVVGGRRGWRLPTVQELASLIDPDNPGGNPDLPPGHPFSNVQSSDYWSATTIAINPTYAWGVSLTNGVLVVTSGTGTFFVWCVRGGHGGPDAQ